MTMGKTTYEILVAKGYQPQQPLLPRKTIVTQELGKKYLLDVKGQLASVVFQVDGNIIKSGRKCDKMILVSISSEAWAQIFVELKGHDSIHGMEQLLASVRASIFASSSNKVRKARLVATSFPSNRANPMVEKLKREFCKLKVDYRNLKPGQRDVL